MAMPVEFREFTPKNARNDLMRRLEVAPQEHVEAMLALYQLVQRMHDNGVIDLANGLLSAGGTVVDELAALANSPEMTGAMRLTFMATNLIRAMDMDKMHEVLSGQEAKPVSLMQLGRQAMSKEARTGIAAALGVLTVFGAALDKQRGAPTGSKSPLIASFTERFFRARVL